jgi:hypothetical protein
MNSFRNHRLRDIVVSPDMIRLRLRDLKAAGRNYGRIYAYDKYLRILNEGTEP